MKKTDIREGVTYQTKNGSAARSVITVTDDHEVVAKLTKWGVESGWTYVVYRQERGPGKGRTDVLALESFASWAHSEDAGAPAGKSDLSARISQLQANNAALMEVARKAGCIKHWHDAMADNSGMVVSADAVRDLWGALSALPAHLKEEASK